MNFKDLGKCFSVLFVSAWLSMVSSKKLTETTLDNCEVCVTFMDKFINSLDKETMKSQEKIETAFKKMCKKSKKDDNRFCYYIGGLEESATAILGEMSKPVSWGMPADKVCIKLYRKDQQICDLKYEKSIDFAVANFKKMKVGELKNILSDWDERCLGCTEKSDYIRMIEEKMPIHAPEAYAKRKQQKEL
jgi:hypothetical protein